MSINLRIEKVSRIYDVGGRKLTALHDVSLAAAPGQVVALRGRSGSGKTTLLNCIGALDRPTAGQIWLDGHDITQLSEGKRVRLRRQHIGFVFQSHALLPTYSARENVDLMLRLAGMGRKERQQRAAEVLA
ncbi:MAG TPA: ATP-binding cassette domain-containing protein, partial [Chloroflexota bacterium]|nr:ATP-binding cassette domain-containing protein [Chloroflexota bacterium]